MLNLIGMNFEVVALRLRCKVATLKIAVIVKKRFLQKAFKIFWSVARKLFKVFDEMGLVKEIVFVADFS